ncbi:MAG TPA: hypothetical protein VHP12_08015 [Chitinophagaceae bacterium]|nr:hypothetical protein [Chitinophagaceae bacterium]
MPIHAVLTGDIVNSTKLTAVTEKKLVKALNGILQLYKFEFYRGDSFQVYMKEPGKALRVALLCRTAAIKAVQDEDFPGSDIRISIGIGNVKTPVKTLGSAKGEAFTLSGRLFDEMQKTGTRLSMAIEKDITNTALSVIADYINAIFNKMTVKQAEVVFLLLKGETQQAITDTLKKSKSTISQFAGAARWAEIEKLLQHYENLINQSI